MPAVPSSSELVDRDLSGEIRDLYTKLIERSPHDAVRALAEYPEAFVEKVLELLNPAVRQQLLDAMPRARRELVLAAADPANRRQWLANDKYAEHTVGRLMEPALAVFPPEATIAEAVERLRALTQRAIITYLYVVDAQERLVGTVVMREMLLGQPGQKLSEVMIAEPFALRPEQTLGEAKSETVLRHYPVYPVVDGEQRIVGLVRGQMLFEAQAAALSAQAGAIIGVQWEERLATDWQRSLRFRHPWLQINLLTTFLAAAVVGVFQGTITRMAVLATFLPVLAGQCANVGGQALAVSIRGLTLGELHPGRAALLAMKESWLGLLNGFLTGLTAAVAMYVTARWQGYHNATSLALVVLAAMTGSCLISGLSGAMVPVVLRRCGFDPATASGIVLTTITDVISLGSLLGLAAGLAPA